MDGYFCAGDAPGMGPLSMVDYLNLRVRHVDSTDTGGSSYLVHVAHAAEAIALGKCRVALITLAVLVPVGMVVAVVLWVAMAIRRRRREQALDLV